MHDSDNGRKGSSRRTAAVAAVAALSVVLGLGAAAPAAQALVSCSRDNGLTMDYVPSSGNWKSYNVRRASGCGAVRVNWSGWTDTPDDCFYVRARTYRNGDMTLHPWRGPHCYLGQYPVLSDVPEGREVRLEVKHMAEFLQTRSHVPILTWTY